jgi:hypothetical protein
MENAVVNEAVETAAEVAQEAVVENGSPVKYVLLTLGGVAVCVLGYNGIKWLMNKQAEPVKAVNDNAAPVDAEVVDSKEGEKPENVEPEKMN